MTGGESSQKKPSFSKINSDFSPTFYISKVIYYITMYLNVYLPNINRDVPAMRGFFSGGGYLQCQVW